MPSTLLLAPTGFSDFPTALTSRAIVFFTGMPIPLTSTGLKTKQKKKILQPALRTTFKTAENGHKLLQDVDVARTHSTA